MNFKKLMQLPKNYNPSKDWHLLILFPVALILLADIFIMPTIESGGVVSSVTSGILSLLFFAEVFMRTVRKKTLLGYKYSLFLAMFCLAVDILIYLPIS